MPTIREVYNPLIEARNDQARFDALLQETGRMILEANPDKCADLAAGVAAAKDSLDYYCQYFDDKVAAETKKAMGTGNHWVSLGGHKVLGAYS